MEKIAGLDPKKILPELYKKNLELYTERLRIQEIINQIAEVVFAVDGNYKITLFNKVAKDVFEISEELAIGKKADDVVKIFLEGLPLLSSKYAFIKESKQPVFFGKTVTTKDKTGKISYYRLNYSHVDFEDLSKECVVTLTNITNEVMEDRRKDEFISITGHELKTPVAIVKNNLWMFKYLLGKDFSLNLRQKELLDGSFEELIHLNKLITDLLDLSRIAQNRLLLNVTNCNLDLVLKDIYQAFLPTAQKKGLQFKVLAKSVGLVKADKERIYEVFENLLSNAFKYTEKGFIKISSSVGKNMVKVSISDSGAGIAEKDFSKMFTKFGRGSEGLKVHENGASTGLGLYVTKNLVQAMGGEIGFKSVASKGSTFWLTLKRA